MPQVSEHIVYFHPSQQLQNYQSVSFHCADEAYDSSSSLFRTQSQWKSLPRQPFENGDISMSQYLTSPELNVPGGCERSEPSDPATSPTDFVEELPRAAIADLFQRVADYERDHPEIVRDSGKVWIRVNSVGRGLSTRIRTIGWPGKKPSFEARVGNNVPVHSRMRVYEKLSRTKRIQIAVHDCWRRFRNRSTGRDTELWARKESLHSPYPVLNMSILSLALPNTAPTGSQVEPRKLSRTLELEHDADKTMSVKSASGDSNVSFGEELKRRKSSLFLDVYPSDLSVDTSRA